MAAVFTHPWLSGHFGDEAVAAQLSATMTLQHMLRVEAAFSHALGACGLVDTDVAEAAARAILDVDIAPEDLKAGTAADGLPVPALVRCLKTKLPKGYHKVLHNGLTSQDVMDTALMMSLADILTIFVKRLDNVAGALAHLDNTFGKRALMGRTRMQAALPITVTDRIRTWQQPLSRHQDRLAVIRPQLLQIQLSGPVGDGQTLHGKQTDIAAHMAKALDLNHDDTSWHSARDRIADLGNWLSLVTGTLGKMGQDIALMAQQGVDAVAFKGGGSSSAMAHKQNPVLAELLVTLARFNATLVSGMHHSLVHEQERSGVAWTLELMLLPQMLLTTGRSLTAGQELLHQITDMGDDT